MRIVFTVKIAPVISEADVSHNGLFIGLWTEAEVSLGFIVACALSLPKLIQAKGSKLKRAMSKASSPFSSFRGTVRSVSRRDTCPSEQSIRCKGQALREPENGQVEHINAEDAVAQRKRYYQQPSQQQMQTPVGHLHPGAYAQSAAAASSVYSQSPEPRRPNGRDRSVSRDSSIRVAPLRVSMYGPDGRYLGARSPARELSRSEEQLHANMERLQQSRNPGTQEGDSGGDRSITIPVPPKSLRRLSNFRVEEHNASVRIPARRVTREEMTTEQLRQEVEMLQHFNFEMARRSDENLTTSRTASYALPHQHQF